MALDLESLRRRFEALPPLEEMPGERSYIGRCYTWDGFIKYGPMFAAELRDKPDEYAAERRVRPDLVALVLESF